MLGTVTKPVGDRDCYDVDVVARLAAASTGIMSQAQLKAGFGVEIRAYVQAYSMASPPSDGRRCRTLDYLNARQSPSLSYMKAAIHAHGWRMPSIFS
jgi:hypothetical protein